MSFSRGLFGLLPTLSEANGREPYRNEGLQVARKMNGKVLSAFPLWSFVSSVVKGFVLRA